MRVTDQLLGIVSFSVSMCSLMCCNQMRRGARHSRFTTSSVFRTICCYRHHPSPSRPRGALPVSDRGLWQTSNILKCNNPLRGAGSMATGGGDESTASEKVATLVQESDSSSAVDMGLKDGCGHGAEEKEKEKEAGKGPEDVTEQGEEGDGDDEDEEEEEKEKDRRREGKWFQLTGSSSLVLDHGDITKWYVDGKTDVIVNAANEMMLGGGGVDGAIHKAAGKKLLDACYKVPDVRGVRCPVGNAVITPGFNLPASRVIHTVGPVYDRVENPAEILGKAYKNSIALAVKEKVKYIAFPAISCGIYGYPYEEAAKVSIQALQETAGQMTEVHFVFFEPGTYNAWLSEAEAKLDRITV